MRAVLVSSAALGWLLHLGGVGLVLLGLADNSLVPLPGSVDALTVVLAASRRDWWWYYAAMATLGSVLGGYLTFRLGRKGGEETLEKKLPKSEIERVRRIFQRHGFGSVAVPAMLPPPIPLVPFILTAGVMKYSTRRFLLALTAGRAARYLLLAYMGSRYGRQIFGFATRYYKPLLAVAVAGGVVAGIFVVRYVKKRRVARAGKAAKAAPKAA